MAVETRIEEVENDAEEELLTQYMSFFGWHLKSSQLVFNRTVKPIGAISYENLTYIRSETDTINFRRLVFERDLRIPNYKKIVALEEEFWQLVENKTAQRPHEPAPLMNFSEWAKVSKPQIVSTVEKVIVGIFSWPIMSVIVSWLLLALSTSPNANFQSMSSEEITKLLFVTSLPFSIPLSMLSTAIYSRIKSAICTHRPQSKGYKKAQKQYLVYEAAYERQVEMLRNYDYAVERIPEILIEVNGLID